MTDKIAGDIYKLYSAGKLKEKKIKDFLKSYYEGDPSVDCPRSCKSSKPLDCYIEIHQALVNDDGKVIDFKVPYLRDGEAHCCGKQMEDLSKGKYCTVCANHIDKVH